MRQFILLFLVGFLFSCKPVKEPIFVSFNGVNSLKWLDKKNIKFTVGCTLENPNSFALKVKPCSLDVYIEKRPLGVVFLDEKIKIKRKKRTDVEAPISVKLNGGAMLTLMKYGSRDSVTVRLEGYVKGGVFIFSKKVPIKFKKTISPKSLNSFGG